MTAGEGRKEPDAKPRGWRRVFITLLFLHFGVMAWTCLFAFPEGFSLAVSNSAVAPSELLILALDIVTFFRGLWWVFGLTTLFVAVLAKAGVFDRVLKPLIGVLILVCLGTIGLGWYVQRIPGVLEGQFREELLKHYR